MKAVVFHRFGGADVLNMEDAPKPKPKKGEVLIRVKACALNRLDIYLRAELDDTVPLPHILGSDVAGDLDEIGPGVKGWKKGAPVVACPSMICGRCEACKKGEESYCENFGILGWQTQGGYAEYVAVPAHRLIPKPASMTYEEAASIPLVYTTAYHMLFTRGQLKKGETILVMGGSSGVGTVLIQLGKAAGARILATCGDDQKYERLKKLGASLVVNHHRVSWIEEIRKNASQGVDLVCEHLGGDYFRRGIDLLKKGGRIVTIGSIAADDLKMNISTLYRKQVSLIGSYMGSKQELEKALKFVQSGKARPIVDKVFSLEQAREAHRYLEDRKNLGKVVLRI